MAKIKHLCLYIALVLIQTTYSSIPKQYWENLLSHIFFKGYDLIVSLKPDSEESLVSWYKESKQKPFTLTTCGSNFTKVLHLTRQRTRKSALLAVLIEFLSISHLEDQLEAAKAHHTLTSIAQPVYFLIAPTPEIYTELHQNENGLARLAREFSINSDFYIFGEETPEEEKMRRRKSNRVLLNALQAQGFSGHRFPDGYTLTELYSLKNITFLEYVDLRETGLIQKIIRRTDFRQAPILAAAQYGYPKRTNFTSDNSSFATGYEVDQLRFLAATFNFTVVPKMGSGWIAERSDKTLSGMAEQVLTREVDISISASEMLVYRAAQLTFLHPTYYNTIWGFFKQPASNSLRDIFINAFTLDLWLTVFGTWFLIITAMYALAIVKWRLGTLHENDKLVVQEVFIWATGAVCQQGWHVCPESGCMKIVFIFALVTGLVSYVGYSAALVSILSIRVIPIQSLSDLVSYRYTIYQDNHTLTAAYIVKDLENSGAIRKLQVGERSINSQDAIKKIKNGQAAFLGVTDLFYPVARSALCTDLQVCKNVQKISVSEHRPVQGGMFVRKRSAFADFFNHRILLMYERGIRHRLLEDYFRDVSVMCLDLSGSDKEPLGLNDVVTAYIILLLGYVLSLSVFVVEKLCAIKMTNVDNMIMDTMYYT